MYNICIYTLEKKQKQKRQKNENIKKKKDYLQYCGMAKSMYHPDRNFLLPSFDIEKEKLCLIRAQNYYSRGNNALPPSPPPRSFIHIPFQKKKKRKKKKYNEIENIYIFLKKVHREIEIFFLMNVFEQRYVTVWKRLKDIEDGPPFLCPKCGRSYSHKCNLTRHLRLECGLHETFQTSTSSARSSKDPSICQLHLRSAELRSHHLEVAAYGDPRAKTLLLMPNTLEQLDENLCIRLISTYLPDKRDEIEHFDHIMKLYF
ncbi:Gastrula zinc finger protein 5-1 [Vespula maculifrons]|uniref:Gastrula zinc finger protein 5-1 n=1 Tax=Vespula maculifrons TaxID=7453 RepID=A0ABD2C0D4_VESMC